MKWIDPYIFGFAIFGFVVLLLFTIIFAVDGVTPITPVEGFFLYPPVLTAIFVVMRKKVFHGERVIKHQKLLHSDRALFICISVASLFLVLVWLIFEKDNPTPSILISAAALATIGWIIQNYTSRELQRKQHTMNILMQFRNSSEFRRHNYNIYTQYPFGRDVPKKDVKRLLKEIGSTKNYDRENPDALPPVLASFISILNFYEFLAAGFRQEDLDNELIENTIGGSGSIMTNMLKKVRNIVRQKWEIDGEAYEHLRWISSIWDPCNPGGGSRDEWIEDGEKIKRHEDGRHRIFNDDGSLR